MTTILAPRSAKRVPHQMCGFCEAGWGQDPGTCHDRHGRYKGTYHGAVPAFNLGRGNGHAVPGEGLFDLARPWACLRPPARRLFQSGRHTGSAISALIPGVR